MGSRGVMVPCQESSCHVERLMMVRFLSQDMVMTHAPDEPVNMELETDRLIWIPGVSEV